jgi:hypothetical protein
VACSRPPCALPAQTASLGEPRVELRRNTNAGPGSREGRPRVCRKPTEAEASSPIRAAPESSPHMCCGQLCAVRGPRVCVLPAQRQITVRVTAHNRHGRGGSRVGPGRRCRWPTPTSRRPLRSGNSWSDTRHIWESHSRRPCVLPAASAPLGATASLTSARPGIVRGRRLCAALCHSRFR